MPKGRDREHYEQAALFEYIERMTARFPHWRWIHAVPNGAHKSVATRMKFQREGLKPGVPDVSVPFARGGYTGMHIEMKAPADKGLKLRKGQTSPEQIEWLEGLALLGRYTIICYGWEEAKTALMEYELGEVQRDA